ncbi:MAG TPA: 4-hydroxythreonine-4-phosphate dehydrogenase PdxA [Paracoccaceae bacterium]|nr:4-hydroxythreonine-4-phosphate dehydrogenase PdxA [Paracoccaceae bacterium]HMO71607.1 4-hydroxythreonine-4-phosphate dehydrogenase PdxA [Paracoccaceae bacterium]
MPALPEGLPPPVLSCGEPAGIGLELALRARRELGAALPFAWIGDPRHLIPGAAWTAVDDPEAARSVPPDRLPVLAMDMAGAAVPGRPDPANAAGVVEAIARGVELVSAGAASALVTLPIHKQALVEGAGFAFPGHTEYLAALAGVGRVVMMLVGEGLRVVPATIHIPLRDVPARLKPDLLEDVLRITRAGLVRDFALPDPRIAVAGLNPHAGEGGVLGHEEMTVIAPVLDRLRAEGFDLSGPLSADTMFHPAARARYDAAVCMYHDQALIPIKTVDFAGGVNVTLGLPFVRTSPDHGTAFDIAGQGRADPTSTLAAIRLAVRMAAARRGM